MLLLWLAGPEQHQLPNCVCCDPCCSPAHSAKLMFEHFNPKNGQPAPLISQEVYDIIMQVCCPCRLNASLPQQQQQLSGVVSCSNN